MTRKASKLATAAVAASLVSALYGTQAFAADESKPAASTAKAKTDVELAVEKGILIGDGSSIRENAFVTRGELISMINRAAKLEKVTMKKAPFDDLDMWQVEAVQNAHAAGIIQGNGSGKFQPNRAVTREELAVIVVGALTQGQVPKADLSVLNYFKDKDSISEWAKPYIAYGMTSGVFDFKLDSEFKPQASLTRAEAAKALKPVLFDIIDLLTTNDIHGSVEPFFDKNRKMERGGLAAVAGVVNSFRAANPDGVLLLDAGDAWQGTLISNTSNGWVVIDGMKKMGYDAMTVGNHEFDFSLQTLKDNIAKAPFPIVSANIIDEKTNQLVDWIKPSTTVTRKGVKIGVIGASTPQTETTTKSTNIVGLNFPNPAPYITAEAAKLRAAGANLIVADTHLPGENDKTKGIVGELPNLANAAGLSVTDAIVGGHSHQPVAGIVNGVPVIEALSNTNAVGHIQLFLDKETKQVVSRESELLDTYKNLVTADSEVAKIVADYKVKIADKANEVEAVAAEKLIRNSFRYDINGGKDRDGISPLGASITDAMRASEGSDVAFTNAGGIRADVEPGEVTYSEMFTVLPFGNYNVTGTMTAQQLKKALEVLDKYTQLPAIQFSGLKVEWDNTRATGDKFTKITLVDGTPVYVDGKFNETRTFKVTTNDFMATGTGDGYAVFGEVKDWKDGSVMLDAWIKHFQAAKAAGKEISVKDDGRDVRLDLKK